MFEGTLRENLVNAKEGITGTDLDTVCHADLILVMKDGGIIESGSHESLLRLNDFYAELYNSKFETT